MSQSETLLTASKFRVVRETITSAGGKTKTREIIRHPGACVIVPLLEDGRVCLIRNWRIAVNDTLIELPAGTLEPPEPPEKTAARELIEETGYRAKQIRFLHAFFLSPGSCLLTANLQSDQTAPGSKASCPIHVVPSSCKTCRVNWVRLEESTGRVLRTNKDLGDPSAATTPWR